MFNYSSENMLSGVSVRFSVVGGESHERAQARGYSSRRVDHVGYLLCR
jgi:hypothetical protein